MSLGPCGSLEQLFTDSEVLFELESLTPATEGIITERLLTLMPLDATFVNVARGALVDEAALTRLAAARRIRVALDVYTREPLAPDSPLRDLPQVTLFPHVACPLGDQSVRCGEFAIANLERYLRGQKPLAVVDLEVFDRST